MKSISKMTVFFDNGVTKTLFQSSGDHKVKTFETEFSNMCLEKGVTHPFFIASPLMILEYIGKNLPPLASDNGRLFEQIKTIFLMNHNVETGLAEALQLLRNEIKNSPVTDYDFIEKALIKESMYRNPYGAALIDGLLLETISKTSTREEFIDTLALDELQGFNFESVFGVTQKNGSTVQILKNFACFLSSNKNYSIVRAVNQFFNSVPSSRVKNGARQIAYKLNDEKQDRLDTHLIHFACAGFKHEGAVKSVDCFTTEKFERTRDRCFSYLNFLVHHQRLCEKQGINLTFSPGRMHIVDQHTGYISHSLELCETLKNIIKQYDSTPAPQEPNNSVR